MGDLTNDTVALTRIPGVIPRNARQHIDYVGVGVGVGVTFNGKMVTPTGFEPVTAGLEIRCSIQLSYGAI